MCVHLCGDLHVYVSVYVCMCVECTYVFVYMCVHACVFGHMQCCQVYGYIRILRIFKAFLDYGGISPCAAVSTDFSSHARDLLIKIEPGRAVWAEIAVYFGTLN